MRFIVAVCFVLLAGITSGQSYKVINCSNGVTIGGNVVIPGMIIEHSVETINIPNAGHLGVLTHDGFVYDLNKLYHDRTIPVYKILP